MGIVNKNEIMPFSATWIDTEISILSEPSQIEKYHMYHSYVESLKKRIQMNLFTEQKQIGRLRKHGYQRGKAGGRNK